MTITVDFSPLALRHLQDAMAAAMKEAAGQVKLSPLTRREYQVLALVAEGYSNKLIAAELGMSERTVKNHMTYIMRKLRANDRTHAVVLAVRQGWLAI